MVYEFKWGVWVVFDKMGLKVKSLIVTLNNEVLRQEVRVWRLLMSVVLRCRWCFYGLVDFDQEEAFLFSWSSFLMMILGTSPLFDFSITSFYDRLFRISLNPFKRSRFRLTFIFSGTPFNFCQSLFITFGHTRFYWSTFLIKPHKNLKTKINHFQKA